MKFPLLISYAYWDKDVEAFISAYRQYLNVLLDSGAFTTHTQGKEVNLEEYHAFLTAKAHLIDEYIQLDVIGDAETTKENLRLSREAGFNPLPVFTRGHKMEYLEELKDTRFCVGGLMGQDKDTVLDTILSYLPKDNQVHILGCDVPKYFRHPHAPQSMDASSWISGFRYGRMNLFINGKDRLFSYDIARNNKSKDWMVIKQWMLRELGMHVEDFRDRKAWVAGIDSPMYTLIIRASMHRVYEIFRTTGKDQYLIYNGHKRSERLLDFGIAKGWVTND